MPGALLIAYDGSDDARHAIDGAAALLGGGRAAVVLHIWRPVENAPAARFSLPGRAGLLGDAIAELDDLAAQHAHAVADEGRELAARAGFEAAARAQRAERRAATETGTAAVWHTILDVARELGADAIVVGMRGLSAPRALILGSISSGLLHHAHVPVLVVPPPE